MTLRMFRNGLGYVDSLRLIFTLRSTRGHVTNAGQTTDAQFHLDGGTAARVGDLTGLNKQILRVCWLSHMVSLYGGVPIFPHLSFSFPWSFCKIATAGLVSHR